jgi:hypothetical protein
MSNPGLYREPDVTCSILEDFEELKIDSILR